MLKIGLTGGIGSGKSVASKAFEDLGVAVIDTDIIARTVLSDNPSLLATLAEAFGDHIIDADQNLDRKELRKIAFSNSRNKELLDRIMHPAIRQSTLQKISDAEEKKEAYCIIVVPLLVETGFKELVNRVLVVTAPHERKLKWLAKRSELTTEQAEKIMASQSSDAEKLAIADDYIENTKDIEKIKFEVETLHKKYLLLAKKTI